MTFSNIKSEVIKFLIYFVFASIISGSLTFIRVGENLDTTSASVFVAISLSIIFGFIQGLHEAQKTDQNSVVKTKKGKAPERIIMKIEITEEEVRGREKVTLRSGKFFSEFFIDEDGVSSMYTFAPFGDNHYKWQGEGLDAETKEEAITEAKDIFTQHLKSLIREDFAIDITALIEDI